ncbi:MAG TPA: hypothetical protein VLI93_16255 [Acetobacteraceae bacterium]|nr:hypothetical protein [Acetobacteraceae bacterium]
MVQLAWFSIMAQRSEHTVTGPFRDERTRDAAIDCPADAGANQQGDNGAGDNGAGPERGIGQSLPAFGFGLPSAKEALFTILDRLEILPELIEAPHSAAAAFDLSGSPTGCWRFKACRIVAEQITSQPRAIDSDHIISVHIISPSWYGCPRNKAWK